MTNTSLSKTQALSVIRDLLDTGTPFRVSSANPKEFRVEMQLSPGNYVAIVPTETAPRSELCQNS